MNSLEKDRAKDHATSELQELILEAGENVNPIVQVAAARASVTVFRNFYAFLDDSVPDLIALEEAADKGSLNFGLFIELSWERYYRNLRWYKKHSARKNRDLWLGHESQKQESDAIAVVHSILETHLPEAMNLAGIRNIFTEQDLYRMQAGNNVM